MKPITIILEKSGNELYGRMEDTEFLHTTCGATATEVENNLKDLLSDFIQHEGKNSAKWKTIKIDEIVFNHTYE